MAHKVDGKHLASYPDLLLATQKLERWAEARDPLTSKTAATNRSTVMHSQMLGNLFPPQKLKGNHTFAAQAVTIGNDVAEEDLDVEQEGKEEMEPSTDQEVEALGKVMEADQFIKYITHFAKLVELYQNKNKNCFRCRSPDHVV